MFTERLKALRKEAGLTQKDIAQHFKFSQPAYQQWESGKKNPGKETLEKFADFFDVSVDYLLGKTDIKNSSEIDEEKLDRAIDESLGFNGKPATEQERENMKEALRIYLESLNEQ
ncbi:TPA: helix-turn-helix transcriptional regulator [Streptococcus suis]|uniref:helix-turn-helix domain-containing protein n=1 Tax=Streptococcus TaxID=1301 RepID=UPI00041527E1|nr:MULTISPECIES: helix-turn-helix transcriptional regulator [Streptococcus]MBL6440643.1 helix-turn-helix transcriptional regulator [Streptococcus suis]MBM7138569.1 helix-turn-helix transcriptional regulator [Streptococcus suis]MBY0720081.1 helix-turn-helix domain-containing protein [Streptococcus sp. 2018110]MBY4601628.1 helix-turn-helix domain-containing protein [Streptococcus suis]MCO8173380.1 helix-turn-helix domain-containing protein [Streptococcus suis]